MPKGYYFLFLFIFFSCQTEKDAETKQMADQLHNLYVRSFSNVSYPYHNGLQADAYAKQLKGIPISVDIKVRYQYIEQLINAGRIPEALEHLAEHLGKKPCNHKTLKYYKLLGLAYMQMAEEENCVHATGANACVIPISGCLLYTSPSPRDRTRSRMPSSA